MIAGIFLAGCALLLAAYWLYGRFLEKTFEIDPARPTPAHTLRDGVDFEPTHSMVLFGHHFSSIAGAGPIVGPVVAGLAYGWGPTLAWVLLGAIFIGGVHDFSTLMMSIRHQARSIAEICRLYLSPYTYRCLLTFIWLALVYVLVVFTDLTATTFAPALSATLTPEQADQLRLEGGTVATASTLYIALAVCFGLLLRTGRFSLRTGSFLFVPLVFAALVLGHFIPITADRMPVLIHGEVRYTWILLLVVYCFIAAVTPVWILLQPRDYLSSFLLFACLAGGAIGLLASSLTGQVATQYPFFTGWNSSLGPLFPTLFILVACGAVSGFHSIVSSGTTAKQLVSERAVRPVSFGAMLTEAALALIALATVMALPQGTKSLDPMATFANGIGQFLSVFGMPVEWGRTFALLAVSTFLLTTLDTCTRLCRYLVEEFLNLREPRWRYMTTAITVLPFAALVFSRFPDPATPGRLLPAWRVIWPAFGTTNQLLAALALLVVVVWRRTQGRSIWFVALPMVFMLASTVTSMIQLIQGAFAPGGSVIIGITNIIMLLMTGLLVLDTIRNWRRIDGAALQDSLATPVLD